MPKKLWVLPDRNLLEEAVRRLREREDLEFVVLFGSRARGDWDPSSDYDLLVGLRGEDGRRWVDRVAELSRGLRGNIDLFPYSRPEWRRLFRERQLLMLDALEHGRVLFDRGAFARMRRTFKKWREQGLVSPWMYGWRIEGRGEGKRGEQEGTGRPASTGLNGLAEIAPEEYGH